ncbi:hypothetical protein ACOME3_002511 [Neoechinorhynchus agilis]
MPSRSISPRNKTINPLRLLENYRSKTASSILEFYYAVQRTQIFHGQWPNDNTGPVIYWMYRDQRVQDNWAFLYAQKLSFIAHRPLVCCFCLECSSSTTLRACDFMLKGLREVSKSCRLLHIPFCVLKTTQNTTFGTELCRYVQKYNASALVCDFSPLREHKNQVQCIKTEFENRKIEIPLFRVDAHNVIPCWHTSDHLEFAAHTIRRKIQNLLPTFLTEFPPLVKQPEQFQPNYDGFVEDNDKEWDNLYRQVDADKSVEPVSVIEPGYEAAVKTLFDFIKAPAGSGLRAYDSFRNDPTRGDCLSNLSPYFHFGQISPQRCAFEVERKQKSPGFKKGVEAFIEEAVVRRELADNYCFYQNDYDNLKGAWKWAKETLSAHRQTKRSYTYKLNEFEQGKTHDDLWNAAQMEMVKTGKMHGFMRMYWAKKILEWTKSPQEAIRFAVELNDKYEIDGRDPNGYVGVMWSICGVHDRAFAERDVFGKIRFMSYAGCARKFNVQAYIDKYLK